MTTTVIVEAHCDPRTTEVSVLRSDGQGNDKTDIVQDGQRWTGHVYDNWQITVSEVPKK